MTSELSTSSQFLSRVVLPGDSVPLDEIVDSQRVVLGPGLRRGDDQEISVIKSGLLRFKNGIFWVDTHQKRYVPNRNENIIGIVTRKVGDFFRVDIGGSEPANLSYLSFEGATKKNRPNVQVGDIVYAKLLVASRDMEPELVCVDSYGKRSGMGVLSGGGFLMTVPIHSIRKLLAKDSVLLGTLGKTLSFEIAIGMNGRIWIRGKTLRDTICLANAISVAEHMNDGEIKSMASKLLDAMSGF